MKIAYISAAVIPSWTANSVQVLKVCQALMQNGEEVTLYVPGTKSTDWETLSKHYGVSTQFPINWVRFFPAFKKIDFVISALRLARKQKVELVYTRLLWAAVLALNWGFPVILELHDRPIGRMGARLLKQFVRSHGPKLLVLITHSLQKILEREYAIEVEIEELVIAPDGVDLERYRDQLSPRQARQKLGLVEGFTAVYSGGFYEGRGLEILLDLAHSFPKVNFIWVGGREDMVARWKVRINDEQLTNILLTGFVDNQILPLYQMAAEILLMPYGKTIAGSSGGNIADVSSPMKMFEYMASGRVILTSDLPVLREVLNENNAEFYKSGDLQDLKMRFADLMNNESKRNHLASQALQDVSAFSWQERMKKIIKAMEIINGS
jgi:glycosyltransferase involved in cell wall biosynthesis